MFTGKADDKFNFSLGCGTGTSLGLCSDSFISNKPVWYGVEFSDASANAKTIKFGEFTGRALSTGTSGVRPEMLPRYIIEAIEDKTPGSASKILYRVTAMGFGPRKETQAVVQMIFRKE